VAPTLSSSAATAQAILQEYVGAGYGSNLASLAPDVVVRAPLRVAPFVGIEGFRDHVARVRTAFPDLQVEILDTISEDRSAVLRWRMTATQRGVLGAFPPSNRRVTVEALELYRLDDEGRVAGVITELDPISVLMQIGAVPEDGMGGEGSLPKPAAWIMGGRMAYLRRRAKRAVSTPPSDQVDHVGTVERDDARTADTRRTAYEVFDRYIRRLDFSDTSLLTPDVHLYTQARPEPFVGPAEVRGFLETIHAAFPDGRFSAEQELAEGNRATVRWILRGTSAGPLMGVPPSHRPLVLPALEFMRVTEDGRVGEVRLKLNPLSVLTQIGVLPTRIPAAMMWALKRRVAKGGA
jgi:predicted ester cyclase